MGSLNVLALNSGSSSLKFGPYRVDSTGAEKLFGESVSTAEHPDAMSRVASALAASGMPPQTLSGTASCTLGPHCADIAESTLRCCANCKPLREQWLVCATTASMVLICSEGQKPHRRRWGR